MQTTQSIRIVSVLVILLWQSTLVMAGLDTTQQIVTQEITPAEVQATTGKNTESLALDQKIKTLEEKVTALEAFKLRLNILGLPGAGMTVLALLWLYFWKLPKLVEEQAKQKIDALLVSERKTFKDLRMAVISDTQKDKNIHSYLSKIGFSNEKLHPYAANDFESIPVALTDVLFFHDEDDKLSLETITQFTNQYKGQLKFFYFGSKRLPDELFKTIRSTANSKDTLESNLLKAFKI